MNGLDELRGLGEEAFDYLRLRWASLRLGTVERLSVAGAKIVGAVIGLMVVLFALVFLGNALALWLGVVMGSASLGFLAVGGLFLLVGVLFFVVGRRIFAGSMVRFFISLFFTDNDYRHGM